MISLIQRTILAVVITAIGLYCVVVGLAFMDCIPAVMLAAINVVACVVFLCWMATTR